MEIFFEKRTEYCYPGGIVIIFDKLAIYFYHCIQPAIHLVGDHLPIMPAG